MKSTKKTIFLFLLSIIIPYLAFVSYAVFDNESFIYAVCVSAICSILLAMVLFNEIKKCSCISQDTLNIEIDRLESRVKEEVEKNSIKDKELMKAKEKFVRNAVHEINSALTVITLNAEYLMEEYGKNRSTSAILGAAKKLSNSYDDLSYSTVKDSPYYQEEKEIDLSDMLLDRIRFFEDIAELSDISIQNEIASNIKVFMNVVKLTRIIDNNLSNAIKYSYPKNSVMVRCICIEGKITLDFESIGKKIEDKEKIFELYSREDGVKRGHGVGLSMVKEICDESKISIEVICDGNKNIFRYRFSYAC